MASGPITFSINQTALQNKFKRITNLKAGVMPDLYKFFVAETPVRSGNARNNTVLDSNLRIQAQYQYAGVLDAGRGFRDGQMRGSTQAPDGMTKPTTVEAQRLVNQYIQQYGRT